MAVLAVRLAHLRTIPVTCVLDPAIRVGQTRVAVISQTRVVPQRAPNAASFTGGKHPLFVLMEMNDEVLAFDLSGRGIPLAEIERLCPGVCADFTSSAGATRRR